MKRLLFYLLVFILVLVDNPICSGDHILIESYFPLDIGCEWQYSEMDITKNKKNDTNIKIANIENIKVSNIQATIQATEIINKGANYNGSNNISNIYRENFYGKDNNGIFSIGYRTNPNGDAHYYRDTNNYSYEKHYIIRYPLKMGDNYGRCAAEDINYDDCKAPASIVVPHLGPMCENHAPDGYILKLNETVGRFKNCIKVKSAGGFCWYAPRVGNVKREFKVGLLHKIWFLEVYVKTEPIPKRK